MPQAAILNAIGSPPAATPLRVIETGPPAGVDAPGGRPAGADGPGARLDIPPYDLSAALALEREFGISHVVSQILVRRGLGAPADARAFLDAGEVHEPNRFAGIDDAVALIGRHVSAGTRITVHGDYDVDGICATAIAVRALRSLGANVDWFLPSRIDDGYGISSATVQRLAARGTGLVLTVDCGITAVAEVAAARALGVDVVISDHHTPRDDGELPDCPVVHPAVCGYPCPYLCGAGVASKLAQALGTGTVAEDLELVALATVADLVPLRGENRRLVRQGLKALGRTAKPGLRALLAVAKADPSALDSHVLGFRLAPRINAAGRLRRPDAGLELLLTDDPARAQEIAAELDSVNVERRLVEQRLVWEAEAQVGELGERSAYVLFGEAWHPGVIGIVASRIVERHHRPTILIALDGERGTGSGRSIPGFDLLAALRAGADHLERYGGHRAAAGLTITRERLEPFREAIERHAADRLTPELLTPVERVDAIVSGAELGLGLVAELAALEPCGMGNPTPRLLVPGGRFGDLRPMGEGRHARFSVIAGGVRARAVAFGCEGRLAADPLAPQDATFKLEGNVWNGAVEPRLVLCHAQPSRAGAIEVLGEPEDYLVAVLREVDVPPATDVDAAPALEVDAPPWMGADAPPALEVDAPPALEVDAPPWMGADAPPAPRAVGGGAGARAVLDRRGESPLAILTDAIAAGGPVLGVCADVPRRLGGLRARVGGFALIAYPALERAPSLTSRFPQVVALDPPADRAAASLLRGGSGFTHLAWGEAELRFAEQMHELEYGLRASLVAFYRSLRQRERVAGEELERLLRGDGPHGRSARLAGRLVRVLAELELVSLDRDLPALSMAGRAPTVLEHSPSYRAYAQRYEDGHRFLSRAKQPPSA